MTRKLPHVALPRGGAARVSARLAKQGVRLVPATINSVLNFVRGGRSGQPLRNHVAAQALVADPDIRALGICLNDVLYPPIDAAGAVWSFETPAEIADRRRRAAAAAEDTRDEHERAA